MPETLASDYRFDRYLRHEELSAWLHGLAAAHPDLVQVESYGRSHGGRDLWLVAVTDFATGGHDTKPAHWVDASIHAVELTATVAACALIDRLVSGHGVDDTVTRALATRTFYVVPRVNPDGAEWVLADRPRFRRSSVRPWPWRDGHRWPGLHGEDVDGDGRILQMRVADPSGGWMPHPDDRRLMVPLPPEGAPAGTPTYRLFTEGSVTNPDGYTVPTPPAPEGLDLNRNFPAGWSTSVTGSGDHPLSEPEVDALARAIVARPNICGYHAFHTSGGVLLRPSSTRADDRLDPMDLWVWKVLGERGEALTGYPSHSVYEDFTWDRSKTMSGAADDWVYEHLGIYGWTTEFWDVVHAATGAKQSTHFWYTGPTDAEALAVLRWCDEHHPEGHVEWYAFDHPQLGAVELGGWDELSTWTNPPRHLLRNEVAPHADVIIHQALCSPRLEVQRVDARSLGDETWQLDVGVANTGFLPTDVSALARKERLVRPVTLEVTGGEVLDGPARRRLGVEAPGPAGGQLEGRAALRFAGWNDGTPDRALVRFVVRAPSGTRLTITVNHDRSGRSSVEYDLA